jgi:hypothetical protein
MPLIKRNLPVDNQSRVARIIARGVDEVINHRTAAIKSNTGFHGEIARSSDGSVDIQAEISKRPDALWLTAKAIEVDNENDNGDYFSREEVLKSYRTFEGVPVFTNHENDKVEAAKGKVVLAEWDEREGAVYTTFFIDREAFPDLCRAIEEGYITDVSMGTQVDYSTCSVCEKQAYTADQYCDHVQTMKGRTVDGKKVFERNYGLKFIELSVVTDGACEDCTIREVIDAEDFATAQEGLLAAAATAKRLISIGALSKKAGQEEIQQLTEAEELLSNVSKSMIDQREHLDLDFLNKVTEVLANLSHVKDELVDQGYGAAGAGEAVGQEMEIPPMPGMQEGQEPEVPQPVMEGAGAGGIGSVTEPSMASNGPTFAKFSKSLQDLRDLAQKISSESSHEKTRSNKKNETHIQPGGNGNVDKQQLHQQTVSKLANIWENPSVRQFSTAIAEGDFKVVLGGDEVFGLRGGKKVASLKVADLDADVQAMLKEDPKMTAGHLLDAFKVLAEKAPTNTAAQQQMTQERQLETQRGLDLHPRTDEVRQNITEKQLGQDKWGENYDEHHRDANDEARWDNITEKQLNDQGESAEKFEREGKVRNDITEVQLRNQGIKGNTTPPGMNHAEGVSDQLQHIHEHQLDAQRGGDTPPRDVITDKQLNAQPDPWGRRIASREDAKMALSATYKAMAKTAKATGATPDELVALASEIVANPKRAVEVVEKIDSVEGGSEERDRLLQRASYHGNLDTAPEKVEEYLVGSLADAGFAGEVAAQSMTAVANDSGQVQKIADALDSDSSEEVVEKSAVDFFAEAIAETEEETVKVDLPVSDVEADPKDQEAFASAAFERAVKTAASHGVKVTKNISVSVDGDTARVAVAGSKMSDKDTKAAKAAELKERKEARKRLVEAQMPAGGGMGAAPGGDPLGGGGTTMPAAPAGDPGAAGMPPVGALTGAPEGEMEDEGGAEEAMPPGSICPACGSDDVDVSAGAMQCNNCGGKGDITVSITMQKWPDTVKEQGPGEEGGEEEDLGLEEEGGLGEMEGGAGMELPSVGLAASFRVTPEMVKVANNKPIGSFCPSCGSDKVKLATRKGTSRGTCENCGGKHRVDTFLTEDKAILARVEWEDRNVRKLAAAEARTMKESKSKARKLASALKSENLTGTFAEGDLKVKAAIIDDLKKNGLLD